MSMFDYPLHLYFKLVAMAPRIIFTDNKGREILFLSQKVFKLKEDIRIYDNQQRDREIYQIRAEKILDFDTRYHFYESGSRKHIGSVKAKGWRSIWHATYLIEDGRQDPLLYITEDNPWVKVADALIEGLPFGEMLSGFVFHPAYTAYRGADLQDQSQPVMQIRKEASLFENQFRIVLIDPDIDRSEELSTLLSFMLMVQFMRRRG